MLCDGTYGLSSLSKKTRKSNHLQMSLQRQHPECWSGRSLNPGPPARQTGALPTELTRRRLNLAAHTLRSSILLYLYTALGQCVRHKWKPASLLTGPFVSVGKRESRRFSCQEEETSCNLFKYIFNHIERKHHAQNWAKYILIIFINISAGHYQPLNFR